MHGTRNHRRSNAIKKLLATKDNQFVSFLSGLLNYDPNQRLSPKQALFHPFLCNLFPFSYIFGSFSASSPQFIDEKSLLQLDM
jgi:hypothetical protein